MIWKLYYFCLKLLGPCAWVGFYAYNHLFGVKRPRVVLLRADGQVLLVINALGDRRWTLPGGGAKRTEQPVEAAAREIQEELSLTLAPERLRSMGEVRESGYTAPLFTATLSADEVAGITPDRMELYSHGWYAWNQLPRDVQPLVNKAATRLLEN